MTRFLRSLRIRSEEWCMKRLRSSAAMTTVALTALCVGSLALGVPSSPGRGPRPSASDIDSVPLWRALSTDRFAVLGRGHIHGGKWEVFATAQARRNRHREPCLTVARISHDARFGAAAGCGAPAPIDGPLTPPVHPTITEFRRPVGGAATAASYMAMSFAPTIRRVELELVPRSSTGSGSGVQHLRMGTKSLSAAQARKAQLQQFRYVVLAIPREVCLERVTGFDAAGAQVLSAATGECGGGGDRPSGRPRRT
jgi:hypothetical protein